MKLLLTIIAFLPIVSLAAKLECTTERPAFPSDRVVVLNDYTAYQIYGRSMRPGFSIFVTDANGEQIGCPTGACEIVSVTITDDKGTTYAAPARYPDKDNRSWWFSSTYTPTQTRVFIAMSYRIKPSGGSASRPILSTTSNKALMDGNDYLIAGSGVTSIAPMISVVTSSYLAPDQHDFGTIYPATSGTPLVLPSPRAGELAANVSWSGPSGVTMVGTIASTPQDVPQGQPTSLTPGRYGLELGVRASETVTPGPITGNLSLTLTCP